MTDGSGAEPINVSAMDRPNGASDGDQPSPGPDDTARPLLPRWMRFVVMPFFAAAALSMAVSTAVFVHDRNAANSVSPLVSLMGLSDLHGQSAPGFTLTDQRGRRLSLSQLRGKAVLLTFVDARCTCSALVHDLRLADHDLGSTASKVAFVSVNVDPTDRSVGGVQQFTQRNRLRHLGNWYFLTGTLARLRSVWDHYDIKVVVPQGASRAVHTERLYFIDQRGQERYVAEPQGPPQGTGSTWGQGIATYLEKTMAR